MSDSEYILILTTCQSVSEADRIAEHLVTEKLAACVSVDDHVTSVYEWEGRIERNVEALIMIKTRRDLFDAIEKTIKEESAYDCPEIIAFPIVAGSADYLNWVKTVTRK